MRFYTYVYFDENYIPYYVGEGSRRRYLDKHRVPTPPEERILRYDMETKEDSQNIEWFLVGTIGRKDLGKGPLLNLTDGGPGVSHLHGEIERTRRQLISKALEGNQYTLGHTLSEDHRRIAVATLKDPENQRKRAQGLRGNKNAAGPKTEAWCLNQSQKMQGNQHLLGHKFSEETRRQMSESQKARRAREAV